MQPNFRSIVFSFFISLISISCQKEISYENGISPNDPIEAQGISSGTAGFTLEGSPNNCINYVIGGNYHPGTALGPTNLVSINLNVTDTGTYFISTAPINGVKFSTSGMFTSTGLQQVSLTGSGTPLIAGMFNYYPGQVSCSFPVMVTTVSPPVADGILNCSQAWSEGLFQHDINADSSRIFIPVNVTSPGSYSINSAPINGITFSGSGTLELGAGTIGLRGSGVPTNAGVFSLSVCLGTNNCSLWLTFQ